MKKKIINSLKLGSLLGFVSNNIKADYRLALDISTDFVLEFKVDLKGENDTILKDPTKCKGKFYDILKEKNEHLASGYRFKAEELKDIKKKFIPVYYKLKGSEDLILISDDKLDDDGSIKIDDPKNVEEVCYILNNTATNKVTFCTVNWLSDIIESKKFIIDENYIYKVILDKCNVEFDDLDDVKKHFDINIKSDDAKTYNIKITYNYIFKIPGTEEFKISQKDVEGDDFINPLNKLKNLYIAISNINNVFSNYIIKNEAIIYIIEYNSKKCYIISNEKLKGEDIFNILQTKEDFKGKKLKFDTTTPVKKDEADDTVVPGKYKLIDNVMPKKPEEKPEEPKTGFKYSFTGDESLSNCIGEGLPFKQKVTVQSLFKNQDTANYNYIAINEVTNQRFVNAQELEPGTYKLIREEKTQEEKEKNKGQQGQGQVGGEPDKSKKTCGCC